MSKQLPERPNLDHLRTQAKELLSSFRSGDAEAVSRLSSALPSLAGLPDDEIRRRPLALHDAQSALAREYGFKSWPEMVGEVERIRALEGITPDIENSFVASAVSENWPRARRLLELYPGLPQYSPATALVSGEIEVVRAWLSPETVSAQLGPNSWQPLEYVCHSWLHLLSPERSEGLLETARLLLDAGASPNTSHSWREDRNEPLSVLFGAAGNSGNAEIVRLLLERGADPNDGESVYHAAEHDRAEILELLLAHGANISECSEHWKNTPTFFLAGFRPSDPGWATAMKGIRWLLEHSADPNVQCSENQETALHCACRTGNADLVEMLLEFGADPMTKRTDGKTPFELAAITGNTGALRSLTAARGIAFLDSYERLLSACAMDMLESAKEHLAAEPALQDRLAEEGGHAMVKFAELGVTAGVRNLLALGCDVASTGEEGATALHFACFCGWADCVDLLLAHGAPLDVEDDEYHGTPLGWAIQATGWHRNPKADYVRIVRSLLAAGAPVEHLRKVLDEKEEDAPSLSELRPLLAASE